MTDSWKLSQAADAVAFDLHAATGDITIKRNPRTLVPANLSTNPTESQAADFGKYEAAYMLQGHYATPNTTAARLALYSRINLMEAKFRGWCKKSTTLTQRRTAGGADITRSGLWGSFSATLVPGKLAFDYNIDWRTGTVFTLAPAQAAAAAPDAMNATETFTIANAVPTTITLRVEQFGVKVVNEVQGFSPAASKTVGTVNPIFIPAGRVFTVYVVEGYTDGPDHDADRNDIETAVIDWWKNDPITFKPGYLPSRTVTFLGVKFTRRATEPAGAWHYTLEMRRGTQRSLP